MLLSKFAYANFVWIFMSLRALPLKIPQGALPLDPTTFEKVDKTFMFLAMAGYSETGRSESQKFLSNFFQKVCGIQRQNKENGNETFLSAQFTTQQNGQCDYVGRIFFFVQ